jgi:hypothetical protein
MLRGLIRRLPLRGSTDFIDVNIRPGTIDDARTWHEQVQPYMHKNKRVDAAWNWPSMLKRYSFIESLRRRDVSLFCLELPGKKGNAVPLALMMLSEGYPAIDGSGQGSVFLWYLAKAPSPALNALGYAFASPALVLEALLDTAIQRSYELGYDGRVGLHAAPEGGIDLFCKYRDDTRMTALLRKAVLSQGRRMLTGNDDRYFWTGPDLSRSLSKSFDYLR